LRGRLAGGHPAACVPDLVERVDAVDAGNHGPALDLLDDRAEQ
jgi:hypothetical protein